MTDTEVSTEEARKLLDLDLGANDAEAPTLREYLTALLHVAWTCGDNLKRAFGTSGWRSSDVYGPMVRAGLLAGEWHDGDPDDPDDEGYLLRVADEREAEALVAAAIDALSGVPPEAPSVVTVTLPDGKEHRWQADGFGTTDGGGLHVGDGPEDTPGSMIAAYPPGQWVNAFDDSRRVPDDGHRAPSGPSVRPERAEALHRLLSSVRAALFASDLDDGERIAAIRQAHDRMHLFDGITAD